MSGIYIHIPFCKSRCIYCGFYSTTAFAHLRQRYVDAVCREMELRKDTMAAVRDNGSGTGTTAVETVYLGGGTPSQLSPAQLTQLFQHTVQVFGPLSPSAEVTIEVNPDDVTDDFANAVAAMPVNRVSMGIQTFSDDRLKFLHRRHTVRQAVEAVRRLRQAGIGNISIDLMYGFPGETLDEWKHDIAQALALDVEHLSAYSLMYEEGTPLYDMANTSSDNRPAVMPVNEELELCMYETLIDQLTAAGFEHYEISNFAKPGRRSRHNSSYWNDTPYMGLGAAAHSYDGNSRQWNIDDLQLYITAIEQGRIECEREELDADTRYNDMVTVALRTCEGLDMGRLSPKYRRYFMDEARLFIDDGLLKEVHGHVRLTRSGLFVSDMVMRQLMWVE